MKINNVIDPNDFFVESKKAIQVVLSKEELQRKQMKIADKLELVRKSKAHPESLEAYEKLQTLEKELEMKIRFNKYNEAAVPEEYREVVKRNVAVEQLKVAEKANELKAQLKDHIEYLESKVVPLLQSIKELEKLKRIPDQIDIILDGEIGEKVPLPVSYRVKMINAGRDETLSGKVLVDLDKAIKSLKQIEQPVETKGLLSQLKRGEN
ncbi:hypothetical protein EVU96_25050 [Bacillus infantis]|uniref:hypothetical protein n=1 Tax=Bacillus infantis TaxID=324767 RepID=UPI00101D339A|nr:hypothetical protein [Bacillus infantis]RYI25084.1 hypothetical protein EVU96_25050 [Bacillus infantis]